MKRRRLVFLLLGLALLATSARAERVLIVGDSITGHSMNLPCGYVREMRAALAGIDVEVIPFGGSGQQVVSWLSVLKNSETNRQQLDIPNIFVKDELDKKADTVVIFLGMNDATKPTVQLTDESLDQWKKDYQTLIDGVKARTGFKKLILCPPTMLTESPFSNRNVLMDRMAETLRGIAKENDAIYCDIRGEFLRHFINARLNKDDFFFTPDSVHPQADGHALMATLLLRALGQEKIADDYYAKKLPAFLRDFSAPGMALFVVDTDSAEKAVVKGFLRGADLSAIQVTPPEGMTVEKIEPGEDGTFTITLAGHGQALSADVTVKAGDIVRTTKINAPFYVSTPYPGQPFSDPAQFDWEKEKTAIDEDILAGRDPLQSKIDGKPVKWVTARASHDLTGRDDVNTVDFASIADMTDFDKGYLVRLVDSPKAQTATLKINPRGFSTTILPTIYLNGQEVWRGAVSPRLPKHSDEIKVELKEGRNVLAARVNHSVWQWAISLELVADGLTW